jgi:hypothetical protein
MNVELIIDVLKELSADPDYQNLLWSGGVEGEHASFIEAVCGLFNDSGLGRELDSGLLDKKYSTTLCQLARYLRSLLKDIDGCWAPEEIVSHSAMTTVRETAGTLRILFMAESPRAPGSTPSTQRR